MKWNKEKTLQALKDFGVIYFSCFIFYYARHLIFYAPYRHNYLEGVWSSAFLSLFIGTLCYAIFYRCYRLPQEQDKKVWSFFKYSWIWVCGLFLYNIWNADSHGITIKHVGFNVYEEGNITFYGVFYELIDPFLLLALFATILLLRFRRASRKNI